MRSAAIIAVAALAAGLAWCALPARGAEARVPPNLLLNLGLNYRAAAAAYPGAADYRDGQDYLGYFNHVMCYTYPLKAASGGAPARADLSEANGYFRIIKRADARHACGGDSFSGNFLNWASASTLDIVRYGLTGGDRVIDRAGLTVLQRAYLPDGKLNPDFYANPAYFPRKVLGGGAALGVTPFNTPLLYVVSCRNRILFSKVIDGGNCDTPRADNYFGEYLARVKVCDAAEGAARPDLCARYGNAYKPAGSIQQYAGKLRVGVFAYLTEHADADPNLYGGVLRAALDFTGPTRFDGPDFEAAANPRPEWNDINGVQAAGAGVLNYINQFGRAAPARRGVYKNADPLGELYYESLRYLQGRQPSLPAPAIDEHLPVQGHWVDPVTAPCQRSVIVTLANAATAGDRYLPGNTRTGYLDAARAIDNFGASALDAMEWTRRVGELESDPGGRYGNPAPRPGLRQLELQDTGEAGRASYYMAGLAYWAHTTPIRPDRPLRVDNYVIDLDFGGNGRLDDANPRAIKPLDSQLYLSAKYGGFHDLNGDANPFRTVLDGSAQVVNDMAEWRDADGAARHYFLGAEPGATIAAIRAVFAAAGVAPGRVAGHAVLIAPSPAGEGGALFQASYDPADWSGGLARFALGVDADGGPRLVRRLWEAGQLLGAGAGTPAPHTARRIYTLNDDGKNDGKTSASLPFEWARLSAAQRGWLDVPPGPGAAAARVPDGLGEQRLEYLRGERGREAGRAGGIFRRRAGLLGAAIHAAPLYIGAPSAGMQGPGYDAFYEQHKNRRKALYLGANDGMLHAFDAADGTELFAYVPNALLPVLSEFSSTQYAHRPYVDGAAAVGEALLHGQWKSVLVSGMGGGAQGVFALDVSDPQRARASGPALWEFTDRDDAAIGNVLAAPALAKLRTGIKDGVPEYRYFALVASGLNNYANDGKGRSARSAAGALFLLALDKPISQPWQAGVNYYKIAIPLAEPAAPNALGPPALVAGVDGALRYAYAGDLQGNLWRMDFTGPAPWSGALGAGPGRAPLFIARDGAGRRQPISQQPTVAFAPGGGYLVLFGTGKSIAEADAAPSTSASSPFQVQSFYAVRDDLTAHAAVSGRAALAPRLLQAGPAASAALSLRGAALHYAGADAAPGWYLDFADAAVSGERSVSGAVLAAGKIFFNTVLAGGTPCAAPGMRSYALDALSGFAVDADGVGRSGAATGHFLEGEAGTTPVLYQTGALAGTRDATGGAVTRTRYLVLDPLLHPAAAGLTRTPAAADGPGAGGKGGTSLALPARRMSWREVANWRELHEAAVTAP